MRSIEDAMPVWDAAAKKTSTGSPRSAAMQLRCRTYENSFWEPDVALPQKVGVTRGCNTRVRAKAFCLLSVTATRDW